MSRTYLVQFKNPPSPQQANIYDAILDSDDSIIVQSTAGSGKTTTLVGIAQLLAASGRNLSDIMFVAFNKAIVNELKERLPQGILACTMHSFGMSILRDNLGDLKVENFKYSNIIRDLLADEGIIARRHPDFRAISDSVKDLLNTVRIGIYEYDIKEALLNLLEDTQPDFPKGQAGVIVSVTQEALAKGIRLADRKGEIDFTDMLWLPWKLDLKPKTQYGTVMVDELQDQSPLQRWLVLRAIKPGGRAVGVGDVNQTIYLFTGATLEGMELFRKAVSAVELPLSVTWRCPKSHVELAQAVVGETAIQAAPGAKDGTVGELSQMQFKKQVREGDVILARTNRPLISQAFEFIREGRRAKIRGRDIGQGLIKTAESIQKEHCSRNFSIPDFIAGLEDYRAVKTGAIYSRSDLNEEQVAQRVAEINDRVDVLAIIAENTKAPTPEGLRLAIEGLFDDNLGDFILLSTIHKAKGLEFEDVYVIDPDKIPAPFARSIDDKAGERCCLFVALTRAKRSLFFVEGLPNHAALRELMARKYPPQQASGAA